MKKIFFLKKPEKRPESSSLQIIYLIQSPKSSGQIIDGFGLEI